MKVRNLPFNFYISLNAAARSLGIDPEALIKRVQRSRDFHAVRFDDLIKLHPDGITKLVEMSLAEVVKS